MTLATSRLRSTALCLALCTLVGLTTAPVAAQHITSAVDDFNAFVLEDYSNSAHGSDAEGRVAVGGDFNVPVSYTINSNQGNQGLDYTTIDAFVVDGDIVAYQQGQVWGNAIYGGTSNSGATVEGNEIQDANRIDFAAASQELRDLADALAAETPNGSYTDEYGTLTFTGTNPSLNVFSVPASTFSGRNTYNVNVPSGATAIVNVTGTGTVNFQNAGVFVNGSQDRQAGRNVLFNFQAASQLNMAGIGVQGSILAPRTAVQFSNGQLNGQLVARSFNGPGELHDLPFTGTLPGGSGADGEDDDNTCTVTNTETVLALLEAIDNADGTTTYRYELTNNANRAVSYFAVELPSGVAAAAPSDDGTYVGQHISYNIENPGGQPFRSAKFESIGEGIKNGETEVFEITLPSGQTLAPDYDVATKFSTTVETYTDFGQTCSDGTGDAPPVDPMDASIGDEVFEDLDGDGQRDAGEPGLDNVDVTLSEPGTDATCGTADDVFVATTLTDGGLYDFTDLGAGSYCVSVGESDAPAGSTLTTDDPQPVDLAESEDYDEADFGFQPAPPPAAIDLALTKTVDDAAPMQGDDVTFTLVLSNDGPDAATGVTVEDVLPAGLDYVGASNSDYDETSGIWNVGVLASGADVTLTITATVTTDQAVQNVAEVATAHEDDVDSQPGNDDGDQSEDDEAAATVTPATPPTTDASIGDEVFEDTNGDGQRDGGEPGLDAVDVTLATPGADATCGTSDDQHVATTTTDDGLYGFTDLAAGTYCVAVDQSDAPDGSTLTTGNDPQTVVLAESEDFDEADFGFEPAPQPAVMIDLALTKTVDEPAPHEGDDVVFTLTLTNGGPDAATGVAVEDVLPSGLDYVTSNATAGSYDSATGLWVLGSPLAHGGSATLTITATVSTDQHVENTAEVASANESDVDSQPGNDDGDQSEDDEAAVGVTPGSTSGGGGAGVESNGNLATKMAQRLFERRQDAQAQAALTPAPIPASFLPGQTKAARQASKSSTFELATLVPTQGPAQTQAYEVTPGDLLPVTNATSVLAVDYLRTEGRRLAAFFGATSPGGMLYDHAKATCDRLGGGRLDNVQLVEIAGRSFVMQKLVHADGAVDYAVSFAAFRQGDAFQIDSRFAPSEYEAPSGTEEVLNLQVWSLSPQYTVQLVEGMLTQLSAEGDVSYALMDAAPAELPQVYVREGRYEQGRLLLTLANRAGEAASATVSGSVAATESDADAGDRRAFTNDVALPAPGEDDLFVEAAVEVGPVFDASFSVGYGEVADQVYYADGPWSYTLGEGATAAVFGTEPAEVEGYDERVYRLERPATLEGRLGSWASLFRYLRPGGQPVDLSAYDAFTFTAEGTGHVRLVIEKASIATWDQYGYAFELTGGEQTLTVPFDELERQDGSPGGFTASDVTLVAFYVTNPGSTQRSFTLHLSDARFTGANAVDTEEMAQIEGVALVGTSPNPFRTRAEVRYALPEATDVRLTVYDVLGREVAVLAQGVQTRGEHRAELDAAGLSSGTYVVRLEAGSEVRTQTVVLVR